MEFLHQSTFQPVKKFEAVGVLNFLELSASAQVIPHSFFVLPELLTLEKLRDPHAL